MPTPPATRTPTAKPFPARQMKRRGVLDFEVLRVEARPGKSCKIRRRLGQIARSRAPADDAAYPGAAAVTTRRLPFEVASAAGAAKARAACDTYRACRERVRSCLTDLPSEDQAKVFGATAARLSGFARARM